MGSAIAVDVINSQKLMRIYSAARTLTAISIDDTLLKSAPFLLALLAYLIRMCTGIFPAGSAVTLGVIRLPLAGLRFVLFNIFKPVLALVLCQFFAFFLPAFFSALKNSGAVFLIPLALICLDVVLCLHILIIQYWTNFDNRVFKLLEFPC